MSTQKEYILSKEQYLENKATWRKYLASKEPGNNWFHLLYLLMNNRNVFAAFGPYTNNAENYSKYQGKHKLQTRIDALGALRSKLQIVEKLQTDYEKFKGWYRDYSPDSLGVNGYKFHVNSEMIQYLLKETDDILQISVNQ